MGKPLCSCSKSLCIRGQGLLQPYTLEGQPEGVCVHGCALGSRACDDFFLMWVAEKFSFFISSPFMCEVIVINNVIITTLGLMLKNWLS